MNTAKWEPSHQRRPRRGRSATNCQFASGNGVFAPVNALPNSRITMISDFVLPVRATPSPLDSSGTQFRVTWNHR